ncbi:nischarin [Trichuris trichiura]|uniref:Origin recognition complex subunit 1 n=1 Tax=Trichuris trichiura TaxID=36087 RepID=A0A077ZCL3_TRITR|nr:nischarin [Trichuris trichiura]
MACFSALELDENDSISFIHIKGYTVKTDFTFYTIVVSVGRYEWTVDRRYSDFDAFNRARHKDKEGPIFPPKRLIGNQDCEFLNSRRKELEIYLRAIFKADCLQQRKVGLSSLPRQLALFLDFHLYEVHAIVEHLAETFATGKISGEQLSLTPLELHAISERFKFAEPSFGCSGDLEFDLGHVAEFISQIRELKICGNKRAGSSNIKQSSLPFSLHYFKSLKTLQISHCDPVQIGAFDAVGSKLVALSVHNTLETIANYDDLQIAFRGIQRLDLTCNCLTEICNLQHLPFLRELNLSNNRIEKVDNWHCKLGNVKKIWLTNNKVRSLKGFSRLYSLEFLDIRDNQLTHLRHVWPLGQLPCLKELVLSGNGVENGVDARTRVLEAFGERAAEVTLDGQIPTQRELDTVGVRLAIRKAKEERKRQLIALTEQLNDQLGLAEAKVAQMSTAGQRRKNGVERALFIKEASSTEGTAIPSGQAVNGTAAATKNPFDDLKARLHASAIPKNLPCREQQFQKIKTFISCCLKAEVGGCIYVSGVPGTGKTVTIRHAVHSLLSDKNMPKFSYCEVNGMQVLDPKCVYLEMVRIMKKDWKFKSTDNARKLLNETFSKVDRRRLPIVLLMDEVDLLISVRQRVLYQLFDWSNQEEAKLIVIAVANTLDFPERVLSKRISSRVVSNVLLNFHS